MKMENLSQSTPLSEVCAFDDPLPVTHNFPPSVTEYAHAVHMFWSNFHNQQCCPHGSAMCRHSIEEMYF